MATKKKRVKEERILAFFTIGLFTMAIVFMALVKVNDNIREYSMLREKGAEERKNAVHAGIAELADDSRPPLPTQKEMAEREEKPLDKQQQLLKEAGVDTDTDANWNLIESVGCIVEHEVGYDESYFPGFDFDELQQVMAKSVINRLRSSDFPNNLYFLVNQQGQYPDVWEYICEHHHRVKDETQINVIKVLYNREDYYIPDDVYFEHSFLLDEELEEPKYIGEATPAVGNIDQAVSWLSEQEISTELYPFASFIYVESEDVQRLVVFSGSPSGPY
ncbi:MAG: hypothetical protein J6N78_02980 [Clostridia bacterium]|nr:hypothetical protein [Clostridia bacterium]